MTNLTLTEFLNNSDTHYLNSIKSLSLFQGDQTSAWTVEQKKHFAAVFYHLRGHFINFAWYVGNFCTNNEFKKTIISNLEEELGLNQPGSHEFLYQQFAQQCGVDIQDEIINETHYFPCAKEYNKGHLKWLSHHDEEERLAAFAAYERLDNLDYPCLAAMASTLNLPAPALTFFKVHINVSHFDATLELLKPLWNKQPEKIIKAFEFIYSTQAQMWSMLSQQINSQTSL